VDATGEQQGVVIHDNIRQQGLPFGMDAIINAVRKFGDGKCRSVTTLKYN
jgi:hypothetical protein